jgi:hypothetical protein
MLGWFISGSIRFTNHEILVELNLIEPILSPRATVELNRFTTQLTPLLEQLTNQTREFPALV